MAGPVAGIQPEVLKWARATAGYSVDEAAKKLKCDPTELINWETGKAAPTYAQLEKLAYLLYRRPLALFFLPEPPQEPDFKQEFLSLSEVEPEQLSPDALYLLRLAYALRLTLAELNDGISSAERRLFEALKIADLGSKPT
ncbi:helix-turn-helix transcriptional regulator [Romeria aff. gracilis LEGE 07310]|uniref:Helix-turn-helix transcriptional regulator n=1 Tax=Vasconcelosia minhoensis LEGE 07310 TaxID=915328 RepID=A0A8J7AT68_9CYAN|nr:helix-turn-helix transcriptional regulator [Romeria gracilis]MBE9075978.1 helix-turn-helix transcriptional regulator [Romeria aff. gracilis LEGE 07310]